MTRLVDDALNVPLHDDPLAEEVDLVTRLMVVCNRHDRRLTQCEIDEALGLGKRLRLVSPRARSGGA